MNHDRYCDKDHDAEDGCNAFDCPYCGGNDWHGGHERWCNLDLEEGVTPCEPGESGPTV